MENYYIYCLFLFQLELQRQQLLGERQQFQRDQLKAAELRALQSPTLQPQTPLLFPPPKTHPPPSLPPPSLPPPSYSIPLPKPPEVNIEKTTTITTEDSTPSETNEISPLNTIPENKATEDSNDKMEVTQDLANVSDKQKTIPETEKNQDEKSDSIEALSDHSTTQINSPSTETLTTTTTPPTEEQPKETEVSQEKLDNETTPTVIDIQPELPTTKEEEGQTNDIKEYEEPMEVLPSTKSEEEEREEIPEAVPDITQEKEAPPQLP